MQKDHARLKILRVEAEAMVYAVRGMRDARQRIEGCTCIPDGCQVKEVHGNYRVNPPAFDVLIEHPSFEEAPLWQELPVLWCQCRLNVVPIPPKPRGLIRLPNGKYRFAEPYERPEVLLEDGGDNDSFDHVGGTDPATEGWTRLSDEGAETILQDARDVAATDKPFDFMVDGNIRRSQTPPASEPTHGELWAAFQVGNGGRIKALARAKDAIVYRLAAMLRADAGLRHQGCYEWRGFWSKTVNGQEAIAACAYVEPALPAGAFTMDSLASGVARLASERGLDVSPNVTIGK